MSFISELTSDMKGAAFENFAPSKFNSTGRMRGCNPIHLNDIKYYTRIYMPEHAADADKTRIRECMLARIPIYQGIESIVFLPSGVFTYLISDKGVFINQVYSLLEIGSFHAMLAKRTDANKIFCAGELRISTTDNGKKLVEYNELSGTYMAKMADYKRAEEVMHAVFKQLAEMYPDTMRVEYKKETEFLNVPLAADEMAALSDCGYNVELYTAANDCKMNNLFQDYMKDIQKYKEEYESTGSNSKKALFKWKFESLLGLLKTIGNIDDVRYKELLKLDALEAFSQLNVHAVGAELNSKKRMYTRSSRGGRRRNQPKTRRHRK